MGREIAIEEWCNQSKQKAKPPPPILNHRRERKRQKREAQKAEGTLGIRQAPLHEDHQYWPKPVSPLRLSLFFAAFVSTPGNLLAPDNQIRPNK